MGRRRQAVQEEVAKLWALERQYRGQRQELRVRLLRLLAEEPRRTLREAAWLIGRGERTVQKWWRRYREGGIGALLEVGQAGGKRPVRIGEAGLADLRERLRAEGFADLNEIRSYVRERYGVAYTVGGVWYLVRVKLRAKRKRGRLRAVGQEAGALTAFKRGACWQR